MGNEREDTSRYEATREAVFTETMQIGIVVRDLDATLRRCVDHYGIGPWQLFAVTPETALDLYHDGQPVKGSTRCSPSPAMTRRRSSVRLRRFLRPSSRRHRAPRSCRV